MRNTIKKEIFYTTCRVAEMQVIDEKPTVVERDPERFIGKVSHANIARNLKKMYGKTLVPYDIQTESETYELSIEDFMKYATKIEGDSK